MTTSSGQRDGLAPYRAKEKEKSKYNSTQAKMKLWEEVHNVPVAYTSDFKVGTFEQTAIEGYWFFKKATELWGPCGVSWGYDILEEYYTDGVPLTDPSKNPDMPMVMSSMHTCKIALWFPDCVRPIVQYGHTPYIKFEKGRPSADTEAPKKSLTDAIKKALSMLGFAGEIFLDEMDDERRAIRQLEDSIANANNRDAAIQKATKDLVRTVTKNIATIERAQSLYDVNKCEQVFRRTLHRMKDLPGHLSTCEQGMERISEVAETVRNKLKAEGVTK